MEEEKTINVQTINYRLSQIEEGLAELKTVLLDTKLQEKDIQQIKDEIKKLEENQRNLKNRINELEEAPAKENASKWKYITDIISKIVITGAITFLLIKIGFPIA